MTDNNKPLGEWTLAEVQEYCWTRGDECEEGDCACVNCPFGGDYCKVGVPPHEWDLPELPRWTAQEVEDAKALLRLVPNFVTIGRLPTKHFGNEVLVIEDTNHPNPNCVYMPTTLFPSLELGKRIKLREIAEYKREG